ncbi:hypothetical protein [Ulvibacterium marinum]|uniref:hypothetical protein n=1 Tax=Ulvibacterium marinum TaxID=2419782 RepID=UPI00249486A7|nr:hypothetical protein [Ulvibacterium marinum]
MKSLKKMNFTRLLPMTIGLATLLFFSCNKEESPSMEGEQSLDVVALTASDEAELISEEIITVAEDVYSSDEISTISKASYRSDYLPDCVTVTTVVTDTTKEKTIDFGLGCELPNGNVLSGIIFLSYEKDMELATKTITLSLVDFTFNEVTVEGGATIERVRSNENGNPQADATGTFNGTWPDGSTSNFTGNRTREWIEGYGSGFWGDNVFLIMGKRTYTGPQGNVFIKETITPLRREWSCRFIVSGILEITRNDLTASLDFGDGECDAKGVLTYPDGGTEEIFLRRFRN